MSDRKGFDLGDYVEVKDRIKIFYELFGQGRLVTEEVQLTNEPDGVPRVLVKAAAYRTPDDPLPGRGWSWMELPGKTTYTKGSELENTETSAWGRAIAALGILLDKSIASAQEVANKQNDGTDLSRPPSPQHDGIIGTAKWGSQPVDGQLRFEPDGRPYWGFKLSNGKKSYQVVATAELAMQGVDAVQEDDRVTVWGRMEMVPWRKGDRDMPPYPRIHAERIQVGTSTLPVARDPEQAAVDAIPVAEGQEPLFDPAESARIDAEAAAAG
jgi:hypothetical protein